MQKRRTKIVATIGPRTESKEMLEGLVKNGLNVIRLNMSHGDHAEHKLRIDNAKVVRKKLGVHLPILMDLSGPKIRTGMYKTPTITIEKGKSIILTTKEYIGDEHKIYINYQKLPQEVKKGGFIMLDDGKKKLVVEKTTTDEVFCKVVVGGVLKPRRGVNIPGAYLSVSSITDKDKKDLKFGLQEDIDIVALSFVRTEKDVTDLRKLLKKSTKHIPIIVKIETQEAIDNLDAIIRAADGAMVARGDLAIEVPAEKVPVYQKRIISKCRELGKPVITATQVLESMIHNPVPTRAEISDIANAVYDGTDAVMLSEESTLGEYPIEAVETMSRVSFANENFDDTQDEKEEIQDSISKSVYKTAKHVQAACIVALTESGKSAQLVARFNPKAPVIALTPHEATARVLELSSNIISFKIKSITTIEEALSFIPAFLKEHKLAKKGDTVVVTAGIPFRVSGTTNMLFVIVV